MARLDNFPPGEEYPPRADLRKDVYRRLLKIDPGTIDPAAMTGDVPAIYAQTVLRAVNAALASSDAEKLAECFYPEQAFWRDIVALTSHLRSFTKPNVVAAALLQLKSLRVMGKIELAGNPHFAVMSPVMVSGRVLHIHTDIHARGVSSEADTCMLCCRCSSTAAYPSVPAHPR